MFTPKLANFLCLNDFEPVAKSRLPKPLYGYVSGAAETNATLEGNFAAFRKYGFRTRVMNDVSVRDMKTTLFGETYSVPFGIAPMGMCGVVAYQGDLVLAKAAREAKIPMILSGASVTRMEDLIQAAPGAWFQAYLVSDNDLIDALVDRVAAAGYKTLVVTVDMAIGANRENNVRNGYQTPLRPSLRLLWQGVSHPVWSTTTFARTLINTGLPHLENNGRGTRTPIISSTIERSIGGREGLNWSHIARIRKRWKGNLVLKGILHHEDAARAAAEGADGIVVSNHGGRQLDGTVSPLQVLPGIVDRVGDKTVVMFDSGIRRGTDALKAIALGAKFTFVGRPFLYAAVVGGQPAVTRAIELLRAEISRNLAMLGLTSVSQVSPECIEKV